MHPALVNKPRHIQAQKAKKKKTGIWLLELALADNLSNGCQLIGTDIEARLFPKPDTLPRNINFEVQSVLNLPGEWENRYQLVHQRLLRAAFRTTEWIQALKEIYRVLKPGGWLQLVEGDGWVAGPVMDTFRSILEKLAESRGIENRPGAVPRLKRCLEDCGFVDLRIVCRSTPIGGWAGKDGRDGRDNMLSLYRGIKAPVLAAGGFGIIRDESMYDALLDQVKHEMNSTPSAECRWISICAQKPMSGSS